MKPQDIQEFLQGQFELDCPKIELTPYAPSSKKVTLQGSGYISLSKDGTFDLKFYFPESFSIDEVFERLNWEAGKVIADDAYYNLKAYELSGAIWEAERFIPDRNSGPNGSMIVGKIPELYQKEENHSDSDKGWVQFYFNEIIKVPLNTIVKEQETVGNTTRKMKSGIRLARFAASSIDFEVEENEGHTRLSAISDAIDFKEILINRIFEAFCFVTSNSASWSALVIKGKESTETRIRAVNPKTLKSRISPPIGFQRLQNTDSVWRLFDCYLKYVLLNEVDYFHPISQEIYSVIESGKASLDVEALTLSVSIESLLKEEMSALYKISAELTKNICVAKELIKESDVLDEEFKNRIFGTFSAMKNARAKDILFVLRDKDLIDKELVKTYGDLRNKSAHGGKSTGADVQNNFNRVSAVSVLFYHLIFLVIKYEGEYTDYGAYGYPIKQFNGNLP
jgi:hypothetical protein